MKRREGKGRGGCVHGWKESWGGREGYMYGSVE